MRRVSRPSASLKAMANKRGGGVTTTFFLVRHAAHDQVGAVLCGRMPGVTLGPHGRGQAQRLADRLERESVVSVQASPLERARETAEAIAVRIGESVEICEAITEIDFGSWSGMDFNALSSDPSWLAWNTARGFNRPPNGEMMLEAQARIVGAMERLRRSFCDKAVVLVSHADVIKAALLYHLGSPIDSYNRFDIDPASVSTLVIGDWGSKIVRLNEVVAS
jgi:broad specificity phosphatase PhoE